MTSGETPLTYNKDVLPIISENCFSCHGPDSASRKAGLRLDREEDAFKANKEGAFAIVRGNPGASEVVRRILSTDPDEVMPTPESHKSLKPEQKEILRQWIQQGAVYEKHWSYLPPQRPPVPTLDDLQKLAPGLEVAKWGKNTIDAFTLTALAERDLLPNAEADRRSLARRLSLDLTGLPPEPAEVEAFVADNTPAYYESYVDKLLAKPQFGEHRARYWLDAARYADTHGIHFDNYREIWAYREWVIGAFNRNLPFDQFTIEQLGGDLLPKPTDDQLIATGFHRNNITTNEGGVIAEEYKVLYARDRTETTSIVWMGLTANCAVCHDHKFDAISQKEVYALSAFFNNNTQPTMDGNVANTPPVLFVAKAEDKEQSSRLDKELVGLKNRQESRKAEATKDFEGWLSQIKPESVANAVSKEGLQLHLPLNEGEGSAHFDYLGTARESALPSGMVWEKDKAQVKAVKIVPGNSLEVAEAGDFAKEQAFSVGAWVKLPKDGVAGAVFSRMDETDAYRGWDLWMENGGQPGMHLINRWPEDAIKVVAKKPLKREEWQHVFVTYDGSATAAGMKVYINGEVQELEVQKDTLKNVIHTDKAFRIGQRFGGVSSRVNNLALRDARLYQRMLKAGEVATLSQNQFISEIIAKAPDKRSEADQKALFEHFLNTEDKPWQEMQSQNAKLTADLAEIKKRGAVTHIMNEAEGPAKAHVLERGEYDKPREEVAPATFAVLPPMEPALPRNRLGLAQWLVNPQHPLTARVAVNRMWQELFGTGIVRTAGDFGVSGEMPSHPELLDWLALEFREGGWDVKKFYKLLVTSATYRQAATVTPEKVARDPGNRFWARGPRFRMDAEEVRDYALAVSGLLVQKIGGASVRPYQPEGVWEAVAMPESNTKNYKADEGEGLYRRSIYTFWKRSAPPASMDIFNAPNRETCVMRRERTNTPLQALVTLNDPQFVEAARVLASRVLAEGGPEDEARLDWLARKVLSRPLKAGELGIARDCLRDMGAYFQSRPADAEALIKTGASSVNPGQNPVLLATWTMVGNALMNLDETLNK